MPAAPVKKPATDSRRVGVVAWNLLKATGKGWSVDELLIHPDTAKALCKSVNGAMSTTRPDDEILRALVNARKHGSARGVARRPRKS